MIKMISNLDELRSVILYSDSHRTPCKFMHMRYAPFFDAMEFVFTKYPETPDKDYFIITVDSFYMKKESSVFKILNKMGIRYPNFTRIEKIIYDIE